MPGSRAFRRPGRSPATQAHAGGGIMAIPPNIWQDNFLTGSTPFAVYPRLLSAAGAPFTMAFKSHPSSYRTLIRRRAQNIFDTGNTKAVAPNTIMDVNRYEKDMAALTPSHGSQRIKSQRHRSLISTMRPSTPGLSVWNASLAISRQTLPTWERPAKATPHTASQRLPGRRSWICALHAVRQRGQRHRRLRRRKRHRPRRTLHLSRAANLVLWNHGHGGPGVQASYTWSKSIDDTSLVLGGTGSTGRPLPAFRRIPTTRALRKVRRPSMSPMASV